MISSRAEVISRLAELIFQRSREKANAALRVAVTGITASGKSTLAKELVACLLDLGHRCRRLPIDGFHNPRSIRYRRGRDSAEGYYRDAYDYEQLIHKTLIPLGTPSHGSYVEQVFDLETDTRVDPAPIAIDPGSIVILDASFLLRPEIRDYFDYRIFVQTSFDEARARGVKRDAVALGGVAEAERLYRQRYHAAQKIYFEEARPLHHAHVLFINEQPEAPILFTRA